MSGHHKSDWERVLRQKRAIEEMMEAHTLADVMAREKSPYLLSEQNKGSNRAERRALEARARKGQK